MMKTEYFCSEKVSLAGFVRFCKQNVPLLIAVTLALFFAYGIKLVCYSIGIDTEIFAEEKPSTFIRNVQIGRFGLSLLQRLLYIHEFNPLSALFTAFCLVWSFTLSWCYIIAVFNKSTGRNNKLIPFALLFMTAPIWAEMFYFVFMSAETASIILLCPYVIYLLYKGFLHHEKRKIISAFILLVFMTSVYQAIIPLFCAGVFACFVLLQENSDYEPRVYRLLCLKLFITLIAALAAYFILDKIVATFIFKTEKSEYLDNMNRWGEVGLKRGIMNILTYGYTLTIGHIPAIQLIMARFARTGVSGIRAISDRSRLIGNVLLLPAALYFIIQIGKNARGKIAAGRRFLYVLAGVGVPLSIMLLPILGGAAPPIRAMYALPFASSFMLFYLITKYKKPIASTIAGIALIVSLYQAQITAQLFYSDYLRYQADVHLSLELDRRIIQIQDGTEGLPLALLGKYEPIFQTNFLPGEVIGHSCFDWLDSGDMNYRGLLFMRSLGINYLYPDEDQLNRAREAAVSMPCYPAGGSVKRLEHVIVVKLSDNTIVKTE
jgi:hypothetical protein